MSYFLPGAENFPFIVKHDLNFVILILTKSVSVLQGSVAEILISDKITLSVNSRREQNKKTTFHALFTTLFLPIRIFTGLMRVSGARECTAVHSKIFFAIGRKQIFFYRSSALRR